MDGVRGLKEGTTTITAISRAGGLILNWNVTVRDPNKVYVEDINIDKTEYTIYKNEAIDIPYTYTPENSTNTDFEWLSSNPDILRVYYNRFRGLKEGTAELIVRTQDGTVEKRIKVTIKEAPKVEDIQFEKENYTIGIDEAVDIPYTYLPENSSNAEFSWTSTNSNVLRVYWNRMRGLKAGTAEIIVRTLDGSLEKRIKVTVRKAEEVKVEDIQFEQDEYSVNVDEAVDIPYTYIPTNSTNAEFSWTSTDPEVLRVYWNRFRALKPGTAEIIVKTLDGSLERRIKVIVKDNVKAENIQLEQEEYKVKSDEEEINNEP